LFADLSFEVYEKPSNTQFFYRNLINFRFRVTDQLTKAPVGISQRGGVFMVLSHQDKDRTVVSTKQVTEQDGDDLIIQWKVNLNAIGGKGILTLVGEGADGKEIPLNYNGKAFSLNVEIGGDITEDGSVFTTTNYFSLRTAFIVEFSLSCRNNPLTNVKLRATVSLNGKEIISVPVGTSASKYVASWNSQHDESPSGIYIVEIYREADQLRVSESQENKLKLAREKQREAELAGKVFDEEKFLASIETEKVAPLFSVSVPHKQVTRGGLPFGTEWLLVFPLVGIFFYIDNIKRKYKNAERN